LNRVGHGARHLKAKGRRQKADLSTNGVLSSGSKKASFITIGGIEQWVTTRGDEIATGMTQQRPELFAAYVGTGQVSSWAGTVQFQFDFLRPRYKEKGDTAALAALEAIGKPDPKNVKQYFGFSRPSDI
jgi:hypothetical protein